VVNNSVNSYYIWILKISKEKIRMHEFAIATSLKLRLQNVNLIQIAFKLCGFLLT
jgi:hypothetical protein